MYVAIDETGSFKEGKDLEYGIITLVTISDNAWRRTQTYLDELFPNGWAEIKGKNISVSKRKLILNFMGQTKEIKYTSFLYDLSLGTDEWVDYHKKGQSEKINVAISSLIKNNGFQSMIDELDTMKRRLKSLSVSDYSKFILIYDLYRDWTQFYQYDFIDIDIDNDSWDLNHVIDSQSRAGNFKDLLKGMLTLTTNHLNKSFITYTPTELKDINHPFYLKHEIKYEEGTAIDGHKVYSNMKITSEQDEPVLLLPDLIGNTIHKSIKFRSEHKWLAMLNRLKANRSLIMNNKFRNSRNNYYLVRGFDKSKDYYQLNPIIREHYHLMNLV